MVNVLISTIWSDDSVRYCIHKLGIDEVVLIVDKQRDNQTEKQEKAVDKLREFTGDFIKVRPVETELYDIPKITEDCVRVIDECPIDGTIYINVTPSRKTQSLGLLFAAYKRINLIKGIFYYMEDEVGIIDLPKLRFDLTESQKDLLNVLYDLEGQYENLTKLADKTGISRAMLYKNIDSLEKMGFITKDDTYKLTKAGLIARL